MLEIQGATHTWHNQGDILSEVLGRDGVQTLAIRDSPTRIISTRPLQGGQDPQILCYGDAPREQEFAANVIFVIRRLFQQAD
jgi:hypothetical protein